MISFEEEVDECLPIDTSFYHTDVALQIVMDPTILSSNESICTLKYSSYASALSIVSNESYSVVIVNRLFPPTLHII